MLNNKVYAFCYIAAKLILIPDPQEVSLSRLLKNHLYYMRNNFFRLTDIMVEYSFSIRYLCELLISSPQITY